MVIEYQTKIRILWENVCPTIYIEKYKILEELLSWDNLGRTPDFLLDLLHQIDLVQNGESEVELNGSERLSIEINKQNCTLIDDYADQMEEDAYEKLILPTSEIKELIQDWIQKREEFFQEIDKATKIAIKPMLKEMKRGNGCFLRRKSITLLRPYIDGYCRSRTDSSDEKLSFESGFVKFLRESHPELSSNLFVGWDFAILRASDKSEERGFNYFFELLEEYWEEKL